MVSNSFSRSSHHGNNVSCSNVLVRWQSKQVSKGSPAFGADLFIHHTPFLVQNAGMVFLFTFIVPNPHPQGALPEGAVFGPTVLDVGTELTLA